MRSPWRVPQRSAGRRARRELARRRPERRRVRNCAFVCIAAMVGMRLSALRSLFFCCRARVYFRNGVVVVGRTRTHKRAARTILVICANIDSSPLPRGRGRAEGAGEGLCCHSEPSGSAPSSRPSPRTRGEGVRSRRENESVCAGANAVTSPHRGEVGTLKRAGRGAAFASAPLLPRSPQATSAPSPQRGQE